MNKIDITPAEKDELRTAMGRYVIDAEVDPRLDLPLPMQVKMLMDWACSSRPAHFKRSVPVEPTDHDVLITTVLAKLVRALTDA